LGEEDGAGPKEGYQGESLDSKRFLRSSASKRRNLVGEIHSQREKKATGILKSKKRGGAPYLSKKKKKERGKKDIRRRGRFEGE